MFQGEIAIPQLAVSRVEDNPAEYGTALAVQTAGENNLEVYINEKVVEYCESFFGKSIAQDVLILIEKRQIGNGFDFKRLYTPVDEVSVPLSLGEKRITDLTNNKIVRPEAVFNIYRHYDQKYNAVSIKSDTWSGTTRRIFGEMIPTNVNEFQKENVLITLEFDNRFVIREISVYRYAQDESEYANPTLHPDTGYTVEMYDFDNAYMSYPLTDTDITEYDIAIRGLLRRLTFHRANRVMSPLANYVYYWLFRDAILTTTATGEADLNFSRATNAYEMDKLKKDVNAMNKLIRSWNGMVTLNKDVVLWARVNAMPLMGILRRVNAKNMLTPINSMNI